MSITAEMMAFQDQELLLQIISMEKQGIYTYPLVVTHMGHIPIPHQATIMINTLKIIQ